LGFVSCLVCLSCKNRSNGNEDARVLTPATLAGTYLLTTIQPVIKDQVLTQSDYSAIMAYAKSLEYSFYWFTSDGFGQYLQNSQLQQGPYVLNGNYLTFQGETFREVELRRQSVSMVSSRPVNQIPVDFRFKAYRLNLTVDDLRFSALARAVFTHPQQPESEAQIRQRVKNSLYFYSLFFKAVYKNRFNRFKPAAISLPIRFFRGRIRVPYKFDSIANWTSQYATVADAQKAHALFRKAAKTITRYPVAKTMIHGYSLVLAQMGDAL
jgi:hypothetical protein